MGPIVSMARDQRMVPQIMAFHSPTRKASSAATKENMMYTTTCTVNSRPASKEEMPRETTVGRRGKVEGGGRESIEYV